MRNAIRQVAGSGCGSHLGLAYDVWAPVDASGKVPDAQRQGWLESLSRVTLPTGYAEAYKRWVDALKEENGRADEMETQTRLLIGHGNASPTDVGFTVHQTWGVPVIPGSALKGLLAHYVEAVYGPDPANPNDDDRASYVGVTWNNGRIVHGPGAVYGALFGAPAADQDDGCGLGERAGCVVFHDAWLVPDGVKTLPVAPDVLTVHQKEYYDSNGQSLPNDYGSPVPVAFLTVRPQTKFLVALSGDPAWTEFAMTMLRDALAEWGVGGKTAAGYGRMRFVSSSVRPDRLADMDPRVKPFLDWTKSDAVRDLTARPRERAVRQQWLAQLKALPPEARADAEKVIKSFLKNNKAGQKQLCQALHATSP